MYQRASKLVFAGPSVNKSDQWAVIGTRTLNDVRVELQLDGIVPLIFE